MGLFGRTKWASNLELLRDVQVLVCLCAQITSWTPLVWNFIEQQRQDISSENMYVCFGTLIWSWTPIAHGFAFFWSKISKHIFLQLHIFMFFFLSIPPFFLLFWAVLTPLKHSTSLSAMFVFIHVPPNNPINARAPIVRVPGNHSFPKWSIYIHFKF